MNKNNGTYYIIPTILVLIIVTLFPFLFLIFVSLHEWYLPTGLGDFIGSTNFINILTSRSFWLALRRQILFVLGCLFFSHLIGFLFAILLSMTKYFKGLLTSGFLLPLMLPPIAVGLIWRLLMHPTLGFLNYILLRIGLPPFLWLHSRATVMPSLIIVDVWQWAPFVMLVLFGGINSIPRELFEAADVDGASILTKIYKIIIPLLKPFFIVTFLIRFIWVFTTFDIIMLLTRGGPGEASTTLYLEGYLTSFSYLHMGRGATINFIIFILCFGISFLVLKKFLRPGEKIR